MNETNVHPMAAFMQHLQQVPVPRLRGAVEALQHQSIFTSAAQQAFLSKPQENNDLVSTADNIAAGSAVECRGAAVSDSSDNADVATASEHPTGNSQVTMTEHSPDESKPSIITSCYDTVQHGRIKGKQTTVMWQGHAALVYSAKLPRQSPDKSFTARIHILRHVSNYSFSKASDRSIKGGEFHIMITVHSASASCIC